MPTVGLKRELLFSALGQTFTEEQFDELCFEFGLELDEVVTETNDEGKEEVVYKIDIGANRYDLLCLEGIARALLVFQGKITPPKYALTKTGSPLQLHLDPSVLGVRPHVIGAVLRGVTFNKARYNSFIDLQDKLHMNLARRRTLASMGTHDLDTIQGPFFYMAKKPQDIRFRALNQTKELSSAELLELYSQDSHLKAFVPIIKDAPLHPVILDSNNTVLSLPPIINGEHSKITLNTKNVFIEVTATDLTKASIVLDTLVTMFSQYCEQAFTVEPVVTHLPGGETLTFPRLAERTETISSSSANSVIGVSLEPARVAELLTKMCLESTVTQGDTLTVKIPPTRQDILHPCDIYEDVAIAHGYNNITKTVPKTLTVAQQLPVNKLTDQLREATAQAGFTEALTFSLCSRDDVSTKMRKKIEDIPAVHIANPKTLEFQVARTSLLPGLLKTVQANRKMPLPMKLFEISDVVVRDAGAEVGARNERRMAAVFYNTSPGFEVIHGLLDRVMQLLEVPPAADSSGYHIQQGSDPALFPGRAADVLAYGTKVGTLGVLHPDTLTAFELTLPCSAMEINIEPFL